MNTRSSRGRVPIPGIVTMPFISGAEGYPERERFDLMLLRPDWAVLDRIFAAYAVARRHLGELLREGFIARRADPYFCIQLDLPVDLPLSIHRSVVLEEFGWMRDDLQGHWQALPADFSCEVLGDGDIGCESDSMWTSVHLWERNRRLGVRLYTDRSDMNMPIYYEAVLHLDLMRRLQRGYSWEGDMAIYEETLSGD